MNDKLTNENDYVPFSTHLSPSRCIDLLCDPEKGFQPKEREHVNECPTCRAFLLRMAATFGSDLASELLLDRVEQLREHSEFPEAFRLLTRISLIDGRPEIRQRCALATARMHREMGYFEIAVEQFRSLLETPGLSDQARIACLNNLAWFERQNDHLKEAEELLETAAVLGRTQSTLEIRREYGETLHQQAVLKMTIGDLPAADSLILDALRIRAELDGRERLDVARSLLIQGAIRSKQGKPAAGLELLTQALEIRIQALGENHADVADLLCRIGDAYKKQGHREKAKLAFDRAIRSFQNSATTLLGKIGLARCHARLAEIHTELNQPDQAKDSLSKVLKFLNRYPESERISGDSGIHQLTHLA